MMCADVDKDTTVVTPTHSTSEDEQSESAAPASRPAPANRALLLGQAMNALLQTADVQVQRGDQTRVLSRANEALAEVERRHSGSLDAQPGQPASSVPSAAHPSVPVRPRVDAMLWIVLTAGLFAIVGWMLAYGL